MDNETELTPDQLFIRQWETLEAIPACNVGMGLLQEFAMAHPGAYEFVMLKGFEDFTHPIFTKLPRWQAFVQHRNTCDSCNEV